jgi:MFS family permease
MSYLVARYYGMRNFAGIYAISIATAGASAAIGPLVAGFLYDKAGSYDGFLLFATLPMAIGATLIAVLPKLPPRHPEMPVEPVAVFT